MIEPPAGTATKTGEIPFSHGARDFLTLGFGLGLLTGIGETLLLLVKRFLRHRFITVGEDALWMAPLADVTIFVVFTAIFLIATHWIPPERRYRLFMVFLVTATTVAMLALWGRFHWIATVLLSLGLGLRLAGFLFRHVDRLYLVVRRSIPVSLVFVVLAAGGVMALT
jgi:hypothetical protein